MKLGVKAFIQDFGANNVGAIDTGTPEACAGKNGAVGSYYKDGVGFTAGIGGAINTSGTAGTSGTSNSSYGGAGGGGANGIAIITTYF